MRKGDFTIEKQLQRSIMKYTKCLYYPSIQIKKLYFSYSRILVNHNKVDGLSLNDILIKGIVPLL